MKMNKKIVLMVACAIAYDFSMIVARQIPSQGQSTVCAYGTSTMAIPNVGAGKASVPFPTVSGSIYGVTIAPSGLITFQQTGTYLVTATVYLNQAIVGGGSVPFGPVLASGALTFTLLRYDTYSAQTSNAANPSITTEFLVQARNSGSFSLKIFSDENTFALAPFATSFAPATGTTSSIVITKIA